MSQSSPNSPNTAPTTSAPIHKIVFFIFLPLFSAAKVQTSAEIGNTTSEVFCEKEPEQCSLIQKKTLSFDVLRERLLTINPAAEITAIHEFFTAETADSFHLDTYDYIIDAIDSLKDKALLILMATNLPPNRGDKRGAQFYSSMGAALKLDPTRIKIAEFWKIQGDPLARVLRKRFKREGEFPSRKFECVYSDELVEPQGEGKGSLVHITAIFGFMLAGLVIQDAIKD